MHQSDAGAHQDAAHGQAFESRIGALADRVQRYPACENAGNHRQHGPDRRVGDAAGQREREHPDEMHAPDAAAHRHRSGARPCSLSAARIGGHDPPGDRQRNEGCQGGDDDRQRHKPRIVGADKGCRRINQIGNRGKTPIEVQHRRLAMTSKVRNYCGYW
jgi:hypothetical protein